MKALIIFSLPVSYGWDLFVEGVATYMGWWEYDPPLGPYISWTAIGGLGNMPLLVPIVFWMFFWPNFIAFYAGDPAYPYRVGRIEKSFNLQRLLPATHPAHPDYDGDGAPTRFAWGYEFARLWAWILTFWVTFTVTQLVPMIATRYIFGHDESIYSPWPTWPVM